MTQPVETKLPKDASIDQLWDAAAEHLVCSTCEGKGSGHPGHDGFPIVWMTCPDCQGFGGLLREKCLTCEGWGYGSDRPGTWGCRSCGGSGIDDNGTMVVGRGYVPLKDRDSLEAAVRAKGWIMEGYLDPSYHGDAWTVYESKFLRDVGLLIAEVSYADGLRGTHAVLVAVLRACVLVEKEDE